MKLMISITRTPRIAIPSEKRIIQIASFLKVNLSSLIAILRMSFFAT